MSQEENLGFDPAEIQLLREECEEMGSTFVEVEDEELNDSESGEMAHIQFVGKYKGKEVIYDAVICTLRLHHGSLLFEKALELVQKEFPKYVPMDERDGSYKPNPKLEEEAETLLADYIEAYEDEEEVKVCEHIEYDTELEYGVGIDVALNVDEITDEVIENFIADFNADKLKLDTTLYSFSSMEEED